MWTPPTRVPHATARVLLCSLLAAVVLAALTPSTAHAAPRGARLHHPLARSTSSTYPAAVLELVNTARGHARSCGGVRYPAVGPLQYNARLQRAARSFAGLMGTLDFFDHVAPDGTDPGDRITGTGYVWRRYGENIAAGYATPASVVAGWLASPGHCTNIMTAFKDVGVGYAKVPTSTYGTYWVMDFASR